MSETVRLRDAEGRVHYTARGSQAAEQLLRAGAEDLDAPQTTDPEVTGAEPPAQGDDHDARPADGGSGKRQRAPRSTDHGDRPAG